VLIKVRRNAAYERLVYRYAGEDGQSSQGPLNYFWLLWMFARREAFYECIKAFSETNFTEDIKNFDANFRQRWRRITSQLEFCSLIKASTNYR